MFKNTSTTSSGIQYFTRPRAETNLELQGTKCKNGIALLQHHSGVPVYAFDSLTAMFEALEEFYDSPVALDPVTRDSGDVHAEDERNQFIYLVLTINPEIT